MFSRAMVLPNFNLFSIANVEARTYLDNFSAFTYTLPSIQSWRWFLGFHKRVIWKKKRALKIQWRSEFVLCMRCQACLERRESLNNVRSLKPIPPTNLDFVRFAHLIQWIFLLSPRWPQFLFWPLLSYHGRAPIEVFEINLANGTLIDFCEDLFTTCSCNLSHYPICRLTPNYQVTSWHGKFI